MFTVATNAFLLVVVNYAAYVDVQRPFSGIEGFVKSLPVDSAEFLLEFRDDLDANIAVSATSTFPELSDSMRDTLQDILQDAYKTKSKDVIFEYMDSMPEIEKGIVTHFLLRVINRISASDAVQASPLGTVHDRKAHFWRKRLESFELRKNVIYYRFRKFDRMYRRISASRNSLTDEQQEVASASHPQRVAPFDATFDEFIKAREDRFPEVEERMEFLLEHISLAALNKYVPEKRAAVGELYDNLLQVERAHVEQQLDSISI